MVSVHSVDYTIKQSNKEPLINRRLTCLFGKDQEKQIAIEFCSTPHLMWGIESRGSDREFIIFFWFLISFWITFNHRTVPRFFFQKEYNKFADEEKNIKKNKTLKGKERTKEKGWIRTANREISVCFHSGSFDWTFWADPEDCDIIPVWRNGYFDFKKLIKGEENISIKNLSEKEDQIEVNGNIYPCKIMLQQFKKSYTRWFTTSWITFNCEFGYCEDDIWVAKPVIHEDNESCTYSWRCPREIDNYDEAILQIKKGLLEQIKL